MRGLLTGILALGFLFASVAFGDEASIDKADTTPSAMDPLVHDENTKPPRRENFDSLRGESQLNAAFGIGYGTYSGFVFQQGGTMYYYVTPHFGVGATATIERNGGSDAFWSGSIGPAITYFVPIADRHHVFTEAKYEIEGRERSGSDFFLNINFGYRYFLLDHIALYAVYVLEWKTPNDDSRETHFQPRGGLGFSLHF